LGAIELNATNNGIAKIDVTAFDDADPNTALTDVQIFV
jgi:hypothetical protein